jgi:hypothetical protein
MPSLVIRYTELYLLLSREETGEQLTIETEPMDDAGTPGATASFAFRQMKCRNAGPIPVVHPRLDL